MAGFVLFAGFRGGPAARFPSRGRLRVSVPLLRRSIASFFLALALVPALAAQSGEVVVHAYTFQYQRAREAMDLVSPLISGTGSIELQPGTNTLVIRDSPAAIARIVPVLRKFDHPPRALRLEVLLVRASRAVVSPQVQHSDLPEALTRQLRDLLGYDIYETQARAQISAAEGQAVDYEVGQDYKVSFRFGGMMPDDRVKLSNFRIIRKAAEGRPRVVLLQANLNLWLDRTMNLGLAKTEGGQAVMLVLTLREGGGIRR